MNLSKKSQPRSRNLAARETSGINFAGFSLQGQKNSRNKLVVVVGPTASGKSALGVRLAKKLNGEIISADSRQVYKGLDLASGKVPRDKKPPKSYKLKAKSYFYKGIPHHCLDLVSPKTVFSAENYAKCARKAIKDILERARTPIIVGGTGFYIDIALGLMNAAGVPPDWKLRVRLEKKSAATLFTMLKKLDAARAKTIEPQNKRRLIRAIEIAKYSVKKNKSKKTKNEIYRYIDILWVGIKVKPEELRKNINARLKKRLDAGMVGEIKKLHKSKVSWKRLDDLGLEPRWISKYLRGQIPKDEMVLKLQSSIWRYSRRQMTWFRRNRKIHWISNQKESENYLRSFKSASRATSGLALPLVSRITCPTKNCKAFSLPDR